MLFRKSVTELSDSKRARLILILILLIGLCVRLFQIGHDSLWNDEVGVVLAALAPSAQDTIKAARSHAMAMPLDYLLVRLVATVSLKESALRLPSAIFGCLTLVACYNLFQLVVKKQIALLAVCLLALSPLHVMYSQEVRFYSSLLFFYYLSTGLLLTAIANSAKITGWALFLFTFIIGTYFHIFTTLSMINGIIWIVFNQKILRDKATLSYFLGSLAIAFIAVLPGYLYFGSHQSFDYPLLPWGGSLLKEIALGLGWYELPTQATLGRGWYLACFGLFLIGMIAAIKQSFKKLVALLVSGVVQTLVVIGADLAKGYWFAYRQILFLHPVALLVSSTGLSICLTAIRDISIEDGLKRLAVFALLALLILAGTFALNDYLQWPKSEARQISEYISMNWSSDNNIILVAPGYQEKVYRFYLHYIFYRPDIAVRVNPVELSNVLRQEVAEGTFLIIIEELSEPIVAQLLQMGFAPIKISNKWLGHSLFVRRVE